MSESWRDVVGYEGRYRISSIGRVESVGRTFIAGRGGDHRVRTKIMRLVLKGGRYPAVTLCKDGTRFLVSVHRIVATAFLGLTPDKQVNHINGKKTDNRVENLEVTTVQANIAHAFATGLRDHQFGTGNNKAKLTPDAVRDIRRRIANGETCTEIAALYHVNWSTIGDVKSGHRWSRVT